MLKRSNRLVPVNSLLVPPDGSPALSKLTPEAQVNLGEVHQLRVEAGGMVTLPASFLASQVISEGDVLVCPEADGALRIMNRAIAAARLRESARQRMPGEAALLEALLGSLPNSGSHGGE